MARSTAPAVVSNGALTDTIKAAFAHIYSLDSQIAALKAKYIAPKSDEATAAWRGLKKDTGIERKDLKLFYDIYKRQRMAEDLADEIDRERILDNLRMAFHALQQGEMLSFLEALDAAAAIQDAQDEAPATAQPEADDTEADDGATGHGGWDDAGGPEALEAVTARAPSRRPKTPSTARWSTPAPIPPCMTRRPKRRWPVAVRSTTRAPRRCSTA